ncbi:MAG: cytochrome c [Pseudomonadota bacterium]
MQILSRSTALVTLVACAALLSAPVLAQTSLAFTAAQAENGKAKYKEVCQICHGSSLANGQFGTPLRGSFFRDKWKGKSLGELQQFMYDKMPPDKVMSLTPEEHSDLLAYILSRNDMLPGETALSSDIKNNSAVMLPW